MSEPRVALERRLFTGANTKTYAGEIGPTEVAVAENIDFGLPGIVKGVSGYSLIANDLADTKVLALKRYKKTAGSDLLMMMTGTSLYSWAGTGNWSAAIDAGFTTGLDTLFLVGNDLLIISNGTENVHTYDQSTVTDLGNDADDLPKATVGVYAGNRFWMANTTANPDFLYYSDVLATTCTRATNVIKVDSGEGGAIMGLVEIGNGELLILKEDSIHTLFFTDATATNWYRVKNELEDGACSKKAIVRVGNDVFYLSKKKKGISSVYKNAYDKTTGRQVALSDPILKTYMENINWLYANTATAAVHDNKLIFAVPITPSTIPNYWIILDLHDNVQMNGWSIRKSPPTYCFEKYVVAGFEYLYFGHNADTTVYKALTGNQDNGAAITKTIEFRSEDFRDQEAQYVQKVGDWIELDFLTDTDSGVVNIYWKPDDTDYLAFTNNSFDTSAPTVSLPHELPLTLPAYGKVSKRLFFPNIPFRRFQLKIEQTEDNKNFKFLGYYVMVRTKPLSAYTKS